MNADVALAWLTWRELWRRPGFVAIVSLTLSLGLGALVAAATLVDALLIGPPPFAHHGAIVLYGQPLPGQSGRLISPAAFDAIGQPPGVMSRGLAGVPTTVNVLTAGQARLARARRVDAGFLATLVPGAAREGAWMSFAFWQAHVGAAGERRDPALIIDGRPVAFAGVLPPAWRFFDDVDLLLPWDASAPMEYRAANAVAVARLAPGTSAQAFGAGIAHRLHARPDVLVGADRAERFSAIPIDEAMTTEAGRPVLLFLLCALVQLAIATVNTSSLIRRRALARAYDLGMREALGARAAARWIPAGVEAIVLCLLATAGGIAFGRLLVRLLSAYLPDAWRLSALPVEPSPGVHVFAWFACAVVVGVATLAASSGTRRGDVLRARMAADGWPSAAGVVRRARGMVVFVQIALATLLLLPALTAAARLIQLEGRRPDFDGEHALAIALRPDAREYPRRADVDALLKALDDAAAGLPGVQVAGVSTRLPIGSNFVMQFIDARGARAMFQYGMMTPGAARAMGLRKVAGRWLTADDNADAEPVALVNEAYVRAMDGQGVGHLVTQASKLFATRPLRIVGVVGDTRHAGAALPVQPTVFVPLAQVSEASFAYIRDMVPVYAILRGPAVGLATREGFRDALHRVAPFLASGQATMLTDLYRKATEAPRRLATLMAMFALPAVVLAGVGLYSAQAMEAASRRRDIALGQALGATRTALLARVFRRGMGMAWFGIAAGLLLAVSCRPWWLGDTFHGAAVAASAAGMLLVTLGATLIPALHVISIEPHHVLRGQT